MQLVFTNNPTIMSLISKAETAVYNSSIYNWSLGLGQPDEKKEFVINISSPLAGNPENGHLLCDGIFKIGEDQIKISNDFWEDPELLEKQLSHMHEFSWLRDLRSLGGDSGRTSSRAYISNWIENYYGWDIKTWQSDILSERIKNWIIFYPFYGESADDEFQHLFFNSLEKQVKHLSRSINKETTSSSIFKSLQGLLYSGICLKDREIWIEQSLDIMKNATKKQILSDGMHISRSPYILFSIINIFIEIKSALISAKYPIPVWLQHGLDKMVPAYRFFMHNDKNMAHFNGGAYIPHELVNQVLIQANIRAKTLKSLPHCGYERISSNRGSLIMDTGNSAESDHSLTCHAAPLSFEYSYGKQQIIVNCGQHHTNNSWQNMLRGTAAHSTITIDNRNAFEISNDGYIKRRASNVIVNRQEDESGTIIEASHDGYVSINGIVHRRSIFLSHSGDEIFGEDTLTCITDITKKTNIECRFHIHPDVNVSMTKGGNEILLKLPESKVGFKFRIIDSDIEHINTKVEDSIYISKGTKIVKTKQIIISSVIENNNNKIIWSLTRE